MIEEGILGALDLVYLMQDKIGQKIAVDAAVGIGGGAWKDYVDSSGNLLMTIKITGDDKNELQEINNAFLLWADSQQRFSSFESFAGGTLYVGETNFWISTDSSSMRLVLSQDFDLLNSISNQLSDF